MTEPIELEAEFSLLPPAVVTSLNPTEGSAAGGNTVEIIGILIEVFVAAPAVTALSPTHGPTSGGNQVVITGLRLSGAESVEFGSTVVNAPFTENTETTADETI